MKILGIETSCDETSAAVVENGRDVLSNIIRSQIDIHTRYGGVVPEIASRNHVEDLPYIIDEALEKAGLTLNDIDAIAVTNGPGLVGALLIGVSQAKAMALALDKPLIGVNHIKGHIAANYIEYPDLEPPFLSLIVSGGHTHLVLVKDYDEFEVLGKTLDDAAGEAFDKIARVIGLGYPGGPKIDKAAKEGNPEAYDFPRVYLDKDSLDFSFSGLKSAVINRLNTERQKNIEIVPEDVAASFQAAVVEVLVEKAIKAAKQSGTGKIVLAGGVSANSELRERLKQRGEEEGLEIFVPSLEYCTDNAAMIASMAYFQKSEDALDLDAVPNLKITAKSV